MDNDVWSWSVGEGPAKVTAIELPERGHVVYLRWREHGNWKKQSLKESCRTAQGRLIQTVCDRAKAAARAKAHERAELVDGRVAAGPALAVLTVGATAALVFHPATGRWSRASAHGKEVWRAVTMASQHWGADRAWHTLARADWRSLWRWRLEQLRAAGHAGYRGAELVVQRLATVAEWLVEEGHVLRIQGPERDWRQRLAEDFALAAGDQPEPSRPRHTVDEMRRILEAAQAGDPRFALLLTLGAELRLGQVVRCRRGDLHLEEGTLTVRGRGKKRGVTVQLTDGQLAAARAALEGYLKPLEAACMDYPLFPAGQMPGGRSGHPKAVPERHGQAKPVGRRWILAEFRTAERLAGVPHVEGRAAYGLRRAAVDGVKALGISREGLQAHGGWQDTQIPDRIYAEQEQRYARAEAARLRAVLRAEATP
jgi:integrase